MAPHATSSPSSSPPTSPTSPPTKSQSSQNPKSTYPDPQTNRIYLAPLTIENHLPAFFELWKTEEAVQYTTKTILYTLEEAEEFMKKVLPSVENPDIDKFAIMLKPASSSPTTPTTATTQTKTPICIGLVGTNRWSPQGMETGYSLNRAYWGQGYGYEAFSLFLGYYWTLAHRKSIKTLVAKTHAPNIASIKIVRKCGGVRGGYVDALVFTKSTIPSTTPNPPTVSTATEASTPLPTEASSVAISSDTISGNSTLSSSLDADIQHPELDKDEVIAKSAHTISEPNTQEVESKSKNEDKDKDKDKAVGSDKLIYWLFERPSDSGS